MTRALPMKPRLSIVSSIADLKPVETRWIMDRASAFDDDGLPRFSCSTISRSLRRSVLRLSLGATRRILRRCAGLRGGHYAPTIRVDEAVKMQHPSQWTELWRAGDPGCSFRVYSTPDSNYSSEFFSLYEKAIPYGETTDRTLDEQVSAEVEASRPPIFHRFTIAKTQLPAPLWSDDIADLLRTFYGGEKSDGWIANVLGAWGTPSRAVWGIDVLGPALVYLPRYRLVVAELDTDRETVDLRASRPAPEGERLDGDHSEDLILSERGLPFDPVEIAERIARVVPTTADLVDPIIYAGLDVGERVDPSELTYFRAVGGRLTMLARVRLSYFSATRQAVIVARLDHNFGHRARYSVDAGNAGGALVSVLTQMEQFRTCPACRKDVHFSERMAARMFAERTDAIDISTGEPLANPDRADAPHRLSNKEFSTRVISSLLQAKRLDLPAGDGGGASAKLALSNLLLSHTALGTTSKGERTFKDAGSDLPDSIRQAALAFAADQRGAGGWLPADPSLLVRLGDGDPTGARTFSRGEPCGFRIGRNGVEPLRTGAEPGPEERESSVASGFSIRRVNRDFDGF